MGNALSLEDREDSSTNVYVDRHFFNPFIVNEQYCFKGGGCLQESFSLSRVMCCLSIQSVLNAWWLTGEGLHKERHCI